MGQQAQASMTMRDQMKMQRSMIQANVQRWPKNRQKACNKIHGKIVAELNKLNKEEQAAVATLILLDIQEYFVEVQEAAEAEQANESSPS